MIFIACLDSFELKRIISSDAIWEGNIAGRFGDGSGRIRVRLRCRFHARTGDGLLPFHALRVARPSWAGVLQEHVGDARAFRRAAGGAGNFFRSIDVRSLASIRSTRWHRFFWSFDCRGFSRSANFLSACCVTSSDLI